MTAVVSMAMHVRLGLRGALGHAMALTPEPPEVSCAPVTATLANHTVLMCHDASDVVQGAEQFPKAPERHTAQT